MIEFAGVSKRKKMDIQEWKKLRLEILKLEPLERIKKLQHVIKKVKHPLIIDDIIALLRRTTIELDVTQYQQGGTYFRPSRLEMIERREEQRPADVEQRVEFAPVKKPENENSVSTTYSSSEAEDNQYTGTNYFTQAEGTYKQETTTFEGKEEEFLREGFDDTNNVKKYKKNNEEKESY